MHKLTKHLLNKWAFIGDHITVLHSYHVSLDESKNAFSGLKILYSLVWLIGGWCASGQKAYPKAPWTSEWPNYLVSVLEQVAYKQLNSKIS